MKEQRDYTQDLSDIRSMMERSSKFLSLSGLAGVLAGIYALAGAWFAYSVLGLSTQELPTGYLDSTASPANITQLILLAVIILVLAIGTAIVLSWMKANKRGESAWNATSKRMIANMSVPLVTGGLLILILLSKNILVLIAPLSLIFYGVALYNASKFSYDDVKYLGIVQIGLGLLAALYTNYGLLLWAIGFGVIHIVYGIYMHIRYER